MGERVDDEIDWASERERGKKVDTKSEMAIKIPQSSSLPSDSPFNVPLTLLFSWKVRLTRAIGLLEGAKEVESEKERERERHAISHRLLVLVQETHKCTQRYQFKALKL